MVFARDCFTHVINVFGELPTYDYEYVIQGNPYRILYLFVESNILH